MKYVAFGYSIIVSIRQNVFLQEPSRPQRRQSGCHAKEVRGFKRKNITNDSNRYILKIKSTFYWHLLPWEMRCRHEIGFCVSWWARWLLAPSCAVFFLFKMKDTFARNHRMCTKLIHLKFSGTCHSFSTGSTGSQGWIKWREFSSNSTLPMWQECLHAPSTFYQLLSLNGGKTAKTVRQFKKRVRIHVLLICSVFLSDCFLNAVCKI